MQGSTRPWLAAALAAAVFAGPARAEAPSETFTVLRGDLAPGRARGTLVLTTDASDTRFYLGGRYRHHSVARFAWREHVAVPFDVTMEAQLVTPGRWALEIDAQGVLVILGRDRLGFFVDDAQMMGSVFADLPGVGGPGRRAILIRRTATEIVVVVDGREVGRKAVPAPRTGRVVVGLRGAPGDRSRVVLRDLVVRASRPDR